MLRVRGRQPRECRAGPWTRTSLGNGDHPRGSTACLTLEWSHWSPSLMRSKLSSRLRAGG